jgi:hypothetical protein
MNLEQAQQLIRELGVELGGNPDSYSMDERGILNLVFNDDMPVEIRFEDETMILACVIAQGVDMSDPGLFATLMDYQFMGIRTFGCVLSWNSSNDSLLMSRLLHSEPSARQVAHELNILLGAADQVGRELEPLLDGDLSLYKLDEEEDAGASDDAAPPMMVMNRA